MNALHLATLADGGWSFSAVVGAIFWTVMIVLGLSIVFSVGRLLRGPTLPDRVVALDLFGMLAVGVICVYSVITEQPALLSVGVVMGLILFLGTCAFALYMERRAKP